MRDKGQYYLFLVSFKGRIKDCWCLLIQYIDKETLYAKCTFLYGNIDMLYSFNHIIILYVGR